MLTKLIIKCCGNIFKKGCHKFNDMNIEDMTLDEKILK